MPSGLGPLSPRGVSRARADWAWSGRAVTSAQHRNAARQSQEFVLSATLTARTLLSSLFFGYGGPMPAPLPATEITALLGRGTHFEGKLQFEGRVRIDGSFRGQIRTTGVLVIGDGAEIDAEIEAALLIVKGGT